MNAILFSASQMILSHGVKASEIEQSRRNIALALNTIEKTLLDLDMMTCEWACSDDAYNFIEDVNESYIESNLVDSSLTVTGLNFMLFGNVDGDLVYSLGFDPEEGIGIPVPQELLDQFSVDGLLMNFDEEAETGITGILKLPDGPLLLASRPILNSHDEGPVRGSLLMGRYLSGGDLEHFSENTDLSLRIMDTGDPTLPPELHGFTAGFPKPATFILDRVNGEKMAAYAVIEDITGVPSTVLRIEMPRTLFMNAMAEKNRFTWMFIATGLLLGAIILVFLEKSVLSRLTSLINTFSSFHSTGNPADRVDSSGKDEIAVLGMEINKTLDSLDQSRDELTSKSSQLRTLIENQGEGIVILDRDEMFTFANPAAHRILGLTQGSLVGRHFDELVDPSILNGIRNIRGKCRLTGSSSFEFKYSVTPDERCTILVTATPWIGENDEFLGTFEIFRDISDLKRTEKLKASLAAKSEFLSMVSHELRTPLVPIIGYADMLLTGVYGDMPDESDEPLRTIRSSAEALTNLIGDILELSRTERGTLKVDLKTVEISSLIEDTLKPYHEIDQGKPLEFSLETGNFELTADPARLSQILHNLINNSIKYSGESVQISIRASVTGDTGTISLSDNGIGIPEQELPHIFEGFFQVEDTVTRSRGGAGLGLAIVKKLVEAMNGSITVESKHGDGSTFTITLPLAVTTDDRLPDSVTDSADSPDPSSKEISDLKSGARILVIDDDPVSSRILNAMLEHHNYRVTQAASGGEGLELVRTDPEFDLILLDWMMPDIDGLAVLVSLKSDETSRHIPIVFITGKTEPEDVERGIENGAAEFLSKPFNQKEVLEVVEKVLSGEFDSEPVKEPIGAGNPE